MAILNFKIDEILLRGVGRAQNSTSKKVHRGTYWGLVSIEPENFPGICIPLAHRGMVSVRAGGYV